MDKFRLGLRYLGPEQSNGGVGVPPESSQVMVRRASRQVVSLWTCSKICAISFTVGVVFGFTLKRRLRRWATKLLKKFKDD